MESENVDILKNKFKKINISKKNNIPNGGFPPIIKCTVEDDVININRNREFESTKKMISILDIMTKKM